MTVDIAMSECGVLYDLSIEGAPQGMLKGKTFVVKDFFDVEGFVTGGGNPDWRKTHQKAVSTAPAVELCLSAGAFLKGKSCTDELAFSLDGINPYYGVPRNSQLPDRIPGGSSSGSASSVSCGFVDFGLGTDTLGSIRVPASYCGIFGFRPTHGVISLNGVLPLGPSFDTVGWLARDAETLFDVGTVLLSHGNTKPIKSACIARNLFNMIPVEIGQPLLWSCDELLHGVEGISEIEISKYMIDFCISVFAIIRSAEAWEFYGPWIEEEHPHISEPIITRLLEGSSISQDEVKAARAIKTEIEKFFADLLERNGVIALPTAWELPPLKTSSQAQLDENRMRNIKLTSLAAVAGLPQVSIPIEVNDGVKLGLSLIGAAGQDLELLDFVKRVQPR